MKKAFPPQEELAEKRDLILDPLPVTFDYYPNVDLILATNPHSYMRGSPSALTKQTGNLHVLIRPLREAFYHLIGIKLENCGEKGGVKEMFPYWDEETQTAKWTEDFVAPSDKLVSLL